MPSRGADQSVRIEINISESITASDSISTQKTLFVSLSETVTVSESLTRAFTAIKLISETVNVSEDIIASIEVMQPVFRIVLPPNPPKVYLTDSSAKTTFINPQAKVLYETG